jgi:hypothetical protein
MGQNTKVPEIGLFRLAGGRVSLGYAINGNEPFPLLDGRTGKPCEFSKEQHYGFNYGQKNDLYWAVNAMKHTNMRKAQ